MGSIVGGQSEHLFLAGGVSGLENALISAMTAAAVNGHRGAAR